MEKPDTGTRIMSTHELWLLPQLPRLIRPWQRLLVILLDSFPTIEITKWDSAVHSNSQA